ncbi:MAG TPA: ATP-binding protein [Chitinophagaceae bacterium]|nr:ATP-binding protein [Chitinophagaceae bacterium]
MEISFDKDNAIAGFRLHYLEVLNWGTFHQQIWRIESNGRNALLTGDIGSGKSTLVDAITCLLVPHNKIVFNKAAGAESKERSLLSYIRGEYKKERTELTSTPKQIYLRSDEHTFSVIIGNFYNEGYDEHVCLAQIFWLRDNRPEKLLVIGSRPLTVKQHLSGFTDVADLKKRLRNTPGVTLFDDHFNKYSEHFRHRFGMNSDKAVDLFYQTVSMKSVSSLTEFVRDQMLERTDIREQTNILLKRFEDLKIAHQAVVHAREQYQILKQLVENSLEYTNTAGEIRTIEDMLGVVPSWFASQKQKLLSEAIAEKEKELAGANQSLMAITDEYNRLDNRRFTLKKDIDNNGGRRLEQIGEEMIRHEMIKGDKMKKWDEYNAIAVNCGLSAIENETNFLDNIHLANLSLDNCMHQEITLRTQRDKLVIEQRKKQTDLATEKTELESLRDRKTQIPAFLISLREQLCADLRIAREELPFTGELLKIQEEESNWEGAIERLLHEFSLSMLVPQVYYGSIRRYVNGNVLRSPDGRGIKLNYFEANTNPSGSVLRQLSGNSVVYKLEIKPDTPFYHWIENHLHRSYGEYGCVPEEEFGDIANGITRQGLIKNAKIRHTKDDRRSIHDRKNYVLGWSNLEKIKLLEETVASLNLDLKGLEHKISDLEHLQDNNQQQKEALGLLLHIKEYSSMNWKYDADLIYRLAKEQHELLQNNDLLQTLTRQLEQVNAEMNAAKNEETTKNREIGRAKEKLEDYVRQMTHCTGIIEKISENILTQHTPLIEQRIAGKPLRLNNIDDQQEYFRKQFEGDTGELKKMRYRLTRLTGNIQDKMREIKEHSKAEYSELSTDIEAMSEYTGKYDRLVKEDLKKHEQRFKDELTMHTINGIAVFNNQLDKHEKDIREKIRQINKHLHEIIYDSFQETYITILADLSTNASIRQFREELANCYMPSLSGGKELYNEEKYELVKKILDRMGSAETVDKEWTNTVTDVRQWFDFNASERYLADDTEKEFYEGSGGKSGGQKEKLAYTILASALAYQFGLQFGEKTSRSFRFVVIDEAFGRGSDESTKYGLELFKKLNLQLLIVTPLQKTHVIENHVNSFHFISNRDGNNSQINSLTAEQYFLEKSRRNIQLAG